MPESNLNFKAGYVAFAGRPNVGKSTLLNAYLDFKLAIVTPKPQTTRHRIVGILNGDEYQIIFQDTPGLMKPKYKLHESMIHSAEVSFNDADVMVMITEADIKPESDEIVIHQIQKRTKPTLLAINKTDKIQKNRMLPLIDHYHQLNLFDEIFPVSALKKDGIDNLLSGIIQRLPLGDPLYPEDMITDEPERFFVAEIIRERIFYHFRDEIPYATSVHVQEFKEREKSKDYIEAMITVERESQKGIMIGKGGATLKSIGEQARKQIESFLGRSVFLKLNVRVRPKWRKDKTILKDMGY